MYRAAEYLIETGHAYVDEQTPEEMRANRGDFGKPGQGHPCTDPPAENLARFRAMRAGQLADGAAVLRAKISMGHPNINLRDPALYRIKHAEHHNTGTAWCIYPMYSFAHPIQDAGRTSPYHPHVEFEDQRPSTTGPGAHRPPPARASFAQAKALIEKIEAQGLETGKEFALPQPRRQAVCQPGRRRAARPVPPRGRRPRRRHQGPASSPC